MRARASVLDDEIIIAPLFEGWVVLLGVSITGVLQGLVEVHGVL